MLLLAVKQYRMRIAHFSDPHINLKFHPQHLPRLRRAIEHALERMNADHIVITGDLTSNADIRDLRTIRRLFESLGILSPNKLTIVPGNHDIFGGPHLAEDVLVFPKHCRQTDYAEVVAIFQETFAELFTSTITATGAAYPFLKRVGQTCFLGINSVAEHSMLDNPVGSNGMIVKADRTAIEKLAKHHAWSTAGTRIVLMHHHLFRKKDVAHLAIAGEVNRGDIAARIEQRTLKLHGKRRMLKLFSSVGVDMILHGHIHFTGSYSRHGLSCINSAGAVYPETRDHGFTYHLIDTTPMGALVQEVQVPSRSRQQTQGLIEHNSQILVNV